MPASRNLYRHRNRQNTLPDIRFDLHIVVDILGSMPQRQLERDKIIDLVRKLGWMKYARYSEQRLHDPEVKIRTYRQHLLKRVEVEEVYNALKKFEVGPTRLEVMRAVYGYQDDLPLNVRKAMKDNCERALLKLRGPDYLRVLKRCVLGENRFFVSNQQMEKAGLNPQFDGDGYLKLIERVEEPL